MKFFTLVLVIFATKLFSINSAIDGELNAILENLLKSHEAFGRRFRFSHDDNRERHRFAVEVDATDWLTVQCIAESSGFFIEDRIRWAEYLKPLYREKRIGFIDPLYAAQLQSWSTFPKMLIAETWAQGLSGKGVTVAVLDDGIDSTHDDLRGSFDPTVSYDFISRRADVTPNVIETVNDIDIYSVNWGPADDGRTAERPGPLAQKALEHGVMHNRGESSGVSTSIAIACDVDLCGYHMCASISGSSAAASFAAAILALALEANPSLTQRDVQHLIVHTSDSSQLMAASPEHWIISGADREISTILWQTLASRSQGTPMAQPVILKKKSAKIGDCAGVRTTSEDGLSYYPSIKVINIMNDIAQEVSWMKRAAWKDLKGIEDVLKGSKNTRLRAHLFDFTILLFLTYALNAQWIRRLEEYLTSHTSRDGS
uniref:Peptidase_S8 domain-containing protein n=1 Tax=Angiostrongylus cantonensis TaxID=6313 RepID=A0A158P9E0_ANGCA